MNTARRYANGAGATNTAALCIGGNTQYPGTTNTANVETWNGTAWTEGANLTTARFNGGSGGTSTSALMFGGNVSPNAQTETYDGSSWTEVADLAVGRADMMGTASDNTSALAFGGGATPNTTAAEEWSFVADIQTVAFD